MVVITLNSLAVLKVFCGADYLRVFEADRLQAFARLFIGAQGVRDAQQFAHELHRSLCLCESSTVRISLNSILT
jgi:hypothetical protein